MWLLSPTWRRIIPPSLHWIYSSTDLRICRYKTVEKYTYLTTFITTKYFWIWIWSVTTILLFSSRESFVRMLAYWHTPESLATNRNKISQIKSWSQHVHSFLLQYIYLYIIWSAEHITSLKSPLSFLILYSTTLK